MTPTAGTTLNACAALTNPHRDTYTRAEVAWLLKLSYLSGLRDGRRFDLADWLYGFAEHHTDPPTREDRIAAEIAAAGPAKYPGGNRPVDWDTGQPLDPQ